MTASAALPFRPSDLVVGAVVLLIEADYMYGIGDLRLRLTVTPNVQALWNRVEWVSLTGVELRKSGYEGKRTVLARTMGIKVVRLAPPPEGEAS